MKKMLGSLALVGGIIGVHLALIFGIIVWAIGFWFADKTESCTTKLTARLEQVDSVLTRLHVKVGEVATEVESVNQVAVELNAGIAKNAQKLQQPIEELKEKLAPLVDHAESIVTSMQSFGVLLKSAAELGEQFGQNKARNDQLVATADRILYIAGRIESVQFGLRPFRDTKLLISSEKIGELSKNAAEHIRELGNVLDDLLQQSNRMKTELLDLQNEVYFSVVVGCILIDFVFVWIAFGQVSLALHGNAMIKSSLIPEARIDV
jgi:hypothetical protein